MLRGMIGALNTAAVLETLHTGDFVFNDVKPVLPTLDHGIAKTHANSICAAAGRNGASSGWAVLAALRMPRVPMFAQLCGAHPPERISEIWRTLALLTFAFTTLWRWC